MILELNFKIQKTNHYQYRFQQAITNMHTQQISFSSDQQDIQVVQLRTKIRVLNQQNVIEQYCQICCQYYNKYSGEPLRPALICYDCWYNHIKQNLTKINYMVGSPVLSPFDGVQNIDVVQALNTLEVNQRIDLQQFLFKKYTTFTYDMQKCPSQTCDYVFTEQKCSRWFSSPQQLCPKCDIQLSVPNKYTLKSILGFIYFIFIANKCPKCQIPIERISGCSHMTCPCGHQFCWFCLKDHRVNDRNLYTVHQPKQCAFILLTKITILLTCILSLSCFFVGGQSIRNFMQIVFNFLGYLVHLLLINIFVIGQYAIIQTYQNHPYRNLPFQSLSTFGKISLLIVFNLLAFGCLVLFQLVIDTLFLIAIQLVILGAGVIIVYSVIFTTETWFQYIA